MTRWINLSYPARCPCGEEMARGFKALRVRRTVFCQPCGKALEARRAEREEVARDAFAHGRRSGVED